MKKKFSKLLGLGLTIALLTSLLTVAAPATAMTQPQVAISTADAVNHPAYEIGKTNTYTITFTAGVAANNTADEIVIVFPAGTYLGTAGAYAGTVNIEALAGIGGAAFTSAAGSATVSGTYPAAQTLTIALGGTDHIGAGALVGVTITGIVNPNTPGTYTLTVATQTTLLVPIEAATTSAAYGIYAPTLTPLPGVVLAYNSAGVLMSQSNSINTGIGAAGLYGRVEVGPGTYDEAVNANVVGQTIVASGDPGTVIIADANYNMAGGTVQITAATIAGTTIGVTFDGFQIDANAYYPQATMLTVGAAATYANITNCTISSGTTSAISTTAGSDNGTISNCTISATGTTANTGIIAASRFDIEDCTLTVGAYGTAVTSSGGISAYYPALVDGCTITGSSGTGVSVTAGFAKIADSTLSSLTTALNVTGGAVEVGGNTIDGCGSSTYGTLVDAVEIATGTVNMYNNTIQNSAAANYAIGVASGTLTAHFNNIIDNNNQNINAAVNVDATHNWWGSDAGPASGSLYGAGTITYLPVLGSSATNAKVAFTTSSLLASTTVGVDVAGLTSTGTASAMDVVGVSTYASNPQDLDPTIVGTGSILGYYDIYVSDTTPPSSIQIKFYGAVTAYSKLYYGGALGGQWAAPTTATGAAAWGVNVAGGYAYVTITSGTSPSITDLGGTPFVLLDDKTLDEPTMTTPAVGAYDISIEPTFTWGEVAAAIRYEIALSEDPTFAIPEWSYNVDNNFYKADESLRYNTTYYWRVRGVLGEPYQSGGTWITPSTPWATGIFTTEEEPTEEAATAITVEPTKPEVNVEIPATKITVEPSSQAIPNYMLWIIVAVGAVLVIALIVLIVRTRRVV